MNRRYMCSVDEVMMGALVFVLNLFRPSITIQNSLL